MNTGFQHPCPETGLVTSHSFFHSILPAVTKGGCHCPLPELRNARLGGFKWPDHNQAARGCQSWERMACLLGFRMPAVSHGITCVLQGKAGKTLLWRQSRRIIYKLWARPCTRTHLRVQACVSPLFLPTGFRCFDSGISESQTRFVPRVLLAPDATHGYLDPNPQLFTPKETIKLFAEHVLRLRVSCYS